MKSTPGFVFLAMALVVAASASLQALTDDRWVAPGHGVVVATKGLFGSVIVVCRANYEGGQHPGAVWNGDCNFGWGGVTHYSSTYEVLVDENYRWVTATAEGMPANAIDGGDAGNAVGHARPGVCEAFDQRDSSWHPGKFYANKCYYVNVWDLGGNEIAMDAIGKVHILVGTDPGIPVRNPR
jgi:hypothetical protein